MQIQQLAEVTVAHAGVVLCSTVFDATDPDAVTAAVDTVADQHGRIDVSG
jgi:hypothetical protein